MTTVAPAFQFYARDFLSSDKVSRMTMSERGAYITLLCHAWMSGNGLPPEHGQLARYLRLSLREFNKLWNGPLKECFVEEDGRLVNRRQETVRRELNEYRERQREKGKRGGRPSQIEKPGESRGKAGAKPGVKPEESQTKAGAKPDESPEKALHSALCSLHGTDPNVVPDSEVRASSTVEIIPTVEQRPTGRDLPPIDISKQRKDALSRQPAADGNYSVLLKLTHDVMDAEGDGDPTNPDVIEAVKREAAQRKIVYEPDTLHRALRSAGAQRLKGGNALDSSLAPIADRVKVALETGTLGETMQELARRRR